MSFKLQKVDLTKVCSGIELM